MLQSSGVPMRCGRKAVQARIPEYLVPVVARRTYADIPHARLCWLGVPLGHASSRASDAGRTNPAPRIAIRLGQCLRRHPFNAAATPTHLRHRVQFSACFSNLCQAQTRIIVQPASRNAVTSLSSAVAPPGSVRRMPSAVASTPCTRT